ncbi:hypothetical protein [Natronoglycomyces albus]|uniref:Bacteriocin biosynthesis cyclodehydratase domain-containing protein n=1 Tax=Natronoglycomyces albus TaxID=2811108 RepID=A0A895XP64_9ACTN|nr:hypothetical protein [Natronoglycomyces albus]QSB04080.1 hypothetical protein JQS30_09640 [Natronoglycomyces albus]
MTPRHPLLAPGLAIVAEPGLILIEGGPRRVRISGAASTAILASLLPLLDGHSSPAQLASQLDVPLDHVTTLLDALRQRGLLVTGPGEASPDAATAFVARHLSVTGAHDHPTAVAQALNKQELFIAAPSEIFARLRTDAIKAGMGRVSDLGEPPATSNALVIACDVAEHLPAAYAFARRNKIDLLRVAATGQLHLGPVFTGPATTCLACFRHSGISPASANPQAAHIGIMSALAIAEVHAMATGFNPPRPPHRLWQWDPVSGSFSHRDVVPDPQCPTCDVTRSESTHSQANTLSQWEWLNRNLSPSTISPEINDRDLATSPRLPLAKSGLPPALITAMETARASPAVDIYLMGAATLPYPIYRYSPTEAALIATRADLVRPTTKCGSLALALVACPGRLQTADAEASIRRAFLHAGETADRVATAVPTARMISVDAAELAQDLELFTDREKIAAVLSFDEEIECR